MAAAKTAHTKRRSRVLLAIEIVCLVVMAICAVVLVREVGSYVADDNDFKAVTQSTGRDISALKAQNADCIGWISVADTRIDYPVMYTPQDPEYYLHRNFEKKDSRAGTPFLGAGSNPDDQRTNSQIVYAHHMRDGSMFGELEKFNDSKFLNEHSIEYTTLAGTASYQPIAAFYVDLSGGNVWEYWNSVGALDERGFDTLVSTAKQRSVADASASASYGDKLLMLSTCSYGTSEQRFVVLAKKMG